MRIRLVSLFSLIILQTNVPYATLNPVTGDSSTIWTAIDLLPTQQNPYDTSVAPPAADIPKEPATAAPASRPATIQRTSAGPAAAAPDAAVEPPVVKPPIEKTSEPAAASHTAPAVKKTSGPAKQAAPSHANVDTSTAAPVDTNRAAPGTLIITSVPDSVPIVINDVNVGITPYHATGFYPGLYEIVLYKEGFQQFRQTVDLKSNGTEFVTGTLQPDAGFLFVTSVPESATVILNDTIAGLSPLTSRPLTPGIYRLRVERTGFAPYTEQFGIVPKLTDTIQVTLVSLKKPGIADKLNLKKTRTARRIVFGSVGIVSAATGFFLNVGTGNKLHTEQQALDRYNQQARSEQEYDVLYNDYLNSTKETDRFARARNVCYAIAIIGGTGFALSIPF